MFDRVLNTPPTLREKCPYSKFSWSVFSRIWTKYFPYTLCLSIRESMSVRMRENADKKNSEYGHFSLSATLFQKFLKIILQNPC